MTLRPGDELPSLELPAISRTTLALFAGASNDHNPMHIDIDVARSASLDDVFAHGMLSMGYLGRYLSENFPQEQIKDWSVRFTSITPVQAAPICTGVVRDVNQDDHSAVLDLAVRLPDGTLTITGHATVGLV